MGSIFLRTLLFAAERVRMICLALALVVMVKAAGALLLGGVDRGESIEPAIAQPS